VTATSVVSAPSWLVVVLGLIACGATVIGARVVVRWAAGSGAFPSVASIASPLMAALGAGFAVLAAVTISTEASDVRAARVIVAAEATASARLAWASTTPGVDGSEIQTALGEFLAVAVSQEWNRSGEGQDGTEEGRAALQHLQQVVRRTALRGELPAPVVSELLGAVDAVAASRREHLAAAAHDLPAIYLVTVAISGLALVANAAALTIGSRRRLVGLIAGLALTVSLTLALLVGLSAPFDGPVAVDPAPIDAVAADLRAGLFEP
jgi:hypothetical protein